MATVSKAFATHLERHVAVKMIRVLYNVAFSPDGKLLASGSSDGPIRLWGVGP